MQISNNVAIIAGSTGTLGPQITEKLKSEGFHVYGGSRSTKADFQYDGQQLTDSAYWHDKIGQYAKENSTVLLINTIGQSSPPTGATLRDINISPVLALAQAGRSFAEKHPEIKVVVVQISAIAAIYLQNDDYGNSRAEADEKVVALGTENPISNYKTLALQLPFVFVEPKEDSTKKGHYTIKGLHPWSMEQVAGLPIVPLAGNGDQIIYPVSLNDVTESISKAVNIKDSKAIEVKGGAGLTQKGLIDFYAKMQNRNIIYIPMPVTILSHLLDQFPHGLLAGYAPKVMGQLSNQMNRKSDEPFDELLGRPAQTMEEVHQGISTENVTLALPPIGDHLKANAVKISVLGLITLSICGAIGYSLWQSKK